jgi:hypothetical protein
VFPATLNLPKAGPVRLSHRSILNLLSALCLGVSLLLFGQSGWIFAKAQLAQVLLERAFSQSMASGKPVKAWGWADTWPVARLEISRLQASAIVLRGSSGEALAFGPALLDETARIGEPGTAVIAAHRDTMAWCSPTASPALQLSTGTSPASTATRRVLTWCFQPAIPSAPSSMARSAIWCMRNWSDRQNSPPHS